MKKTKSYLLVLMLFSILVSCQSPVKNDKTTDEDPKSETAAKNEKPLSEKAKLLKSLIGEHKLVSISANMGANTYNEYVIKDGKWKAYGSDWSMRNSEEEPYKIRLSGSDQKKLNSTKVVVKDDLSILIVCEDKTYFIIPFDDNGMSYSMRKAPKEYSMDEAINPSAIIKDSTLYLLAKDNISSREVSFTNYVGIDVDVIDLVYNMREKNFVFKVRYEECCDGAEFVFD
jgi:hypothetical protein